MAEAPKKGHRGQSAKRAEAKRKSAQRVQAMQAQGLSIAETARRMGMSDRYVSELRHMASEEGVGEVTYSPGPPRKLTDLAPEVQACREDTPEGFRRFCDRYWSAPNHDPDEPMPSHIFEFVQAAYVYAGPCSRCEEPAPYSVGGRLLCDGCSHTGPALVEEAVQVGQWRPRVVLNVPPEHCKSSYFTVRWSVWRVARDRDHQRLIISETDDLARQFAQEIASELEENELLLADFGEFRSDDQYCLWQPASGRIRVTGSRIRRGYNLLSRGRGSQIQSLRAHEVVCDDVIGPDDVQSEQQRKQDVWWFRTVVKSRLRPDGIAFVVGTRQHFHDLYDELASRTYQDQPVWQHINFPALRDDLTGIPSVDEGAVALWPARWSKDRLMGAGVYGDLGHAAFSMTYQQQPLPDEERRFRPEWFTGRDDDPDPDRGCFDRTRSWGPTTKKPPKSVRAISLDPSGGVRNAGIVVADVDGDPNVFSCTVLELVRKPMDTRGTLAELIRLCATYKPTVIVYEKNIAKHYESQSEWQALRRDYGVRFIDHGTYNNKADPVLGIESLAVAFEFGRVRLPYGDIESKSQSLMLKTEAIEFPYGRTDDLLHAVWFLYYAHGKKLLRVRQEIPPEWMRASGWATGPFKDWGTGIKVGGLGW